MLDSSVLKQDAYEKKDFYRYVVWSTVIRLFKILQWIIGKLKSCVYWEYIDPPFLHFSTQIWQCIHKYDILSPLATQLGISHFKLVSIIAIFKEDPCIFQHWENVCSFRSCQKKDGCCVVLYREPEYWYSNLFGCISHLKFLLPDKALLSYWLKYWWLQYLRITINPF